MKKDSSRKEQKKERGPKGVAQGLTIGIDLGDRWSEYCVLDAEGEKVEEGRVRMTREALEQRFGKMERARIAVETGAQSQWVSAYLGELGHEVIVANAREVKAITGSDRKSDRVDAEKLARYARVDPKILRPIEHRSLEKQKDLLVIRTRATLVRMRTTAVNSARGLVKSLGYRLPSRGQWEERSSVKVPAEVMELIQPLLEAVEELGDKIAELNGKVEQMAEESYPETARMREIHGVGPLTTVTYVLTLGNKDRFEQSRDTGCYVGMRPRRNQSGKRDPEMGITKAGNKYLRGLLVECAHQVISHNSPDSALKRWGLKLAARGGKNARKRAIVAVARKLAVLLHKLWVSGEHYQPFYGQAAPELAPSQL